MKLALDSSLSYRAVIRRLQGSASPDDPADQPRDEIVALGAAFLFGDLARARALSLAAAPRLPRLTRFIQKVEHNFYTSLTLAGLCDRGTPDRPALEAELAANQTELAIWATNCPENFRAKHLLVSAEVARLAERTRDAGDLYDQAIEAAKHTQNLQEEAVASELCARFYQREGRGGSPSSI